ncbi:tetratricopeptide repeat domain containing protein [Niveomyces insectorum RCEF 264]|uniref:Tetratricopeptide repeat domain containing protein n=1 Tax=Niveomyces insectorum RCEF 264 TaxID=1081102 RepID=A0A167Y063_9HYPO|nr:tetratricopeptide repeat domain containing protein [Niveomyces insectorum RCEF 264]
MSELDTFIFYPLRIDPQTKAVSSSSNSESTGTGTGNGGGGGGAAARALDAELTALNQLHRAIVTGVDAPAGGANAALAGVPPPPIPVNPKRTAQVNKLRDAGNAEFRKGRYAEAIKFYSLGLQMARTRPVWEPPQLVHEEVATLYANRAQAHMATQGWAEGGVDAAASVAAKKTGNAKAWWRRGKCLLEMGRLEEAQEWVRQGLEMEGEEPDLLALRVEVQGRLAKAAEAL